MNRYNYALDTDGRKLTKCGVRISSDARNIVQWKAVDKDGNIIDEQSF